MKCHEFEGTVVDLARGCEFEELLRREAEAHTLECARCASRLAAEWELTAALGAWARSAAQAEAPARVEAALLEAFDRRPGRRLVRRPMTMPPRRWALAAAAAAAVLVAAAWLIWPRRVAAPTVAEVRPSVAAVAARAPQPQPAPARAAVRHARPRPPRAARHEVVTAFYPLAPAAGPVNLDGAPVVRVRLARSALSSFGWPVDPDAQAGAVQADVVLDSDTGMARAIRFVASRP
jgi:hypothetical protein